MAAYEEKYCPLTEVNKQWKRRKLGPVKNLRVQAVYANSKTKEQVSHTLAGSLSRHKSWYYFCNMGRFIGI